MKTLTAQIIDEEWEEVRLAALRTFEITHVNGTSESIRAHYHDGGAAGGLLQFVVVDKDGGQTIPHAYNVARIDSIHELSVDDERVHAARRTMTQQSLAKSTTLHIVPGKNQKLM